MNSPKKNESPLSGVLQSFIKKNKLEKGIDNVNVVDAWKKLMGNGVNNYTTHIELKNTTLFVALSSSVLREELSYGKSKMIALLNEELGKELITKIVLR